MKPKIILALTAVIAFSATFFGYAQDYQQINADQKPLIEAFVNQQNVSGRFASQLAELKTAYDKGEIKTLTELAFRLPKHYSWPNTLDCSAIPYLIALIDADNSQGTISNVGMSLEGLTRVQHSEIHDGAFWRRWWEKNKSLFSEEIQNIKIPELPKTEHGKTYQPYPEELDTLDGKLRFLEKKFESGKTFRVNELYGLAQDIAQHEDPKAIPYLIAAIEADNSEATIRGIGFFGLGKNSGISMDSGLGKFTNVDYSEFHDGAFWRRWWEKNKNQLPEEVRNMRIPQFPKTEHGKTYQPYPEDMETLDGKLRFLEKNLNREQHLRVSSLSVLPKGLPNTKIPKRFPI